MQLRAFLLEPLEAGLDLLGLAAPEPRLEVLQVQEKEVHAEHASPHLVLGVCFRVRACGLRLADQGSNLKGLGFKVNGLESGVLCVRCWM